MAPNFQSSFIPKAPVYDDGPVKRPTGLFGILAVSLFVVSIISSIGLYLYKGAIEADILALKTDLINSEKNIDKATINEMWVFSRKLGVVRDIVHRHQVVSNVLDIVAASAVSTVFYDDFSYSEAGPNLAVSLKGKALNYGSLAQQEDILSQNKNLKSITFSNLGLTEGNLVEFDLTVTVDPKVTIYKETNE